MESKKEQIKKSYLSFRLGEEIFAVSVKKVLEVLEIQRITRVPKTPQYIRGVINFRGEILPVIETRLKFNMETIEETPKTVIIVFDLDVKGKQVVLGAIADSVKDVIEITDDEIKSVPEMGSKYNTKFIKGMIKTNDGFTMLLDIDQVFSEKDLTIIKETGEMTDVVVEEEVKEDE